MEAMTTYCPDWEQASASASNNLDQPGQLATRGDLKIMFCFVFLCRKHQKNEVFEAYPKYEIT